MKNRTTARLAISILIICSLGLFYGYAETRNLWKITDPLDHRFDRQHFDLDNYNSEVELLNALKVLFPEGTPREAVEKLIRDTAGFDSIVSKRNENNYVVTYFREGATLPSQIESLVLDAGLRQAQIEYDTKDRVVSIKAHILSGKSTPKFFVGEKTEIGN